ncbi:hypothetical protein PVAP13_5NG083200 [Panicum virgatum]|uniref:Uncharacterized protein n=1 Tax=Panicum virgatum TaxID=38727 RepID=A0A8T0RNB9_PANVG|nr:hypothetical protein PVAP13_5NG083200 [Panicum virgatum]
MPPFVSYPRKTAPPPPIPSLDAASAPLFLAATPSYLSPSFVAWPRWSPTPSAPLFLAAPPTLRELPVARPHASRWRRRPPTCRPVSLPLCFSLRRRPFVSCQSPARTQVAGAVFSGDGPPGTVARAVKRRCGAWRCPRHRRWCKDAAGAEHHRDDSADIQIGMPFR